MLVCVNAPDVVRHLPSRVVALLDCYFSVRVHLLEVLHVFLSCFSTLCWVQLAVVHVVPCELVVSFWFMAFVSSFVDLCHVLFKVLVDDLEHEQAHVIDAHLCFHAFVQCSFDVLSRCFRFHYNTKEGVFCRDLLHDVPRHECRQDRCRVRCDSPFFFDVDEVLHVVVLMYLHSLPCLSRVWVACNYECRVVLDVFVFHVSIVNVTWVEALDLLHLGFFSDSSSFGFSLCRAPSSRPCSSSCLFVVPRIACHSFIMMFEADLRVIDALRYRPLANAMLVLVFLHLCHHPDLAFFIVGQTGSRLHQ